MLPSVLVAACVALVTTIGALVALALLFVLGVIAFPIAPAVLLASPLIGLCAAGYLPGAVRTARGTLTLVCDVAILISLFGAWRLGLPLLQNDFFNVPVLLLAIAAPTFLATWAGHTILLMRKA